MRQQLGSKIPPIRVYDFFSGCGGTSAGFRQAGIRHALAIDSSPDAIRTFQKNFPDVPVINEPIEMIEPDRIKTYYSEHPEIKLFCGCAPCQPFTKQKTNTKKDSLTDERRGLLTHFANIVFHCLPELIFVENVPGIQKVALENNSPFLLFVNLLKNNNYSVAYDVIMAQNYGAAQVRRRLVLVASRLGAINLPEPTHGPKQSKPYVTVRTAIGNFPHVEQGQEHQDRLRYPNHIAAKLSPLNLERIRHTGSNGRQDWPARLLPKCYSKKPDGKCYGGHSDCYTRLTWDDPAPGLTTRCISYSNGRFGHPEQDRAITVREAAKLQGFPNGFVFTGSLNSMARQVGNAVPVPVAKAFGKHFIKHVKSVGYINGEI